MNRALWIALLSAAVAAPATAFECSSEEVGYFATFEVQPGKEAAFEALATDLTDAVRSLESEAIFYAPYRGEHTGTYHFVERYRTAAARDTHGSAPQIQKLFAELMPLLREPVAVVRLDALCE